jgi:hypothetical protein
VQALEPRSFFVRVLPERPAGEDGATARRGYVVELPDGAQHWFEELEELPALIAGFLDAASRATRADDERGAGR